MLTETFVGSDSWEYLPGRYVHKGDKLRISGGPVYKDSAGSVHRVGERGVFTFCLLAHDATGAPYILVSGPSGGSICIPLVAKRSRLGVRGWLNKPYRLAKVRTAASRS